MLIILFMYALTTLPLSKLLLTFTQPLYLIGLRMAIAGSILLLYHYGWRTGFKRTARKHVWLCVQVTLFAILVPYFLRYWGLMHAVTPRADVWYMAGPLMTYLLTAWMGIERMTWAKTGALCIGYTGLLISMGLPLHAYFEHACQWAELAIIASVLSFAYGWYCIRSLIVTYDYTPACVLGISMLPAGLCALALAYAYEPMKIVGDSQQFVLLLAAVIFVSNMTTHTLYAALLQRYNLTFIQVCSLSVPLFMHLRDVMLGGQAFSLPLVLALPCIVASIALFWSAEYPVSFSNFYWYPKRRLHTSINEGN
jgi:drug/metabolite transporter (DMT)-like permease